MFAAAEGWQVLLFLRLAAVTIDLIEAKIRHGTVGQPHGRRGTADFLHHHSVRQITQTTATIDFINGDAQKAHLAKLGPEVGGKLVVPVYGRRARFDLFLAHLINGAAKHVDFFAETEVEGGITGIHTMTPKSGCDLVKVFRRCVGSGVQTQGFHFIKGPQHVFQIFPLLQKCGPLLRNPR